MSDIHFFQEEITFDLQHQTILTQWINHVVSLEKQEIDIISFIYCSDNYLLDINKTYLDHDYYTDIITFDNRDSAEEPINSDIFISIDRIKDNAKTMNVTFELELHRVMVHGVLHLLGYKDKTDAEKNEMREREEASLSLLQI